MITQTVNVCRATGQGDECWQEQYSVDPATMPQGERTYTGRGSDDPVLMGMLQEFGRDAGIVVGLWLVSALLFVALHKRARG